MNRLAWGNIYIHIEVIKSPGKILETTRCCNVEQIKHKISNHRSKITARTKSKSACVGSVNGRRAVTAAVIWDQPAVHCCLCIVWLKTANSLRSYWTGSMIFPSWDWSLMSCSQTGNFFQFSTVPKRLWFSGFNCPPGGLCFHPRPCVG